MIIASVMGNCQICNSDRTIGFSINKKEVSICESCAIAIMQQQNNRIVYKYMNNIAGTKDIVTNNNQVPHKEKTGIITPTNEEIECRADMALFGFGNGKVGHDDYAVGYIEGSKWMLDLIKGE